MLGIAAREFADRGLTVRRSRRSRMRRASRRRTCSGCSGRRRRCSWRWSGQPSVVAATAWRGPQTGAQGLSAGARPRHARPLRAHGCRSWRGHLHRPRRLAGGGPAQPRQRRSRTRRVAATRGRRDFRHVQGRNSGRSRRGAHDGSSGRGSAVAWMPPDGWSSVLNHGYAKVCRDATTGCPRPGLDHRYMIRLTADLVLNR